MKLMPINDLMALLNNSKNVDFSVNPDLTYNSASDLIEVIDVNKILDNVTIDNGQFKKDLSAILESIIKMHIFTVDFKRFICLEQKLVSSEITNITTGLDKKTTKVRTSFCLHIEDNKISYYYKNTIDIDSTLIASTIELKDDLLIFFKKTTIHKQYRYPSKICNGVESKEECYIYSGDTKIFIFNQDDVENYYIDNDTKEKLLCDEKQTFKETRYSWNETEEDILSKHEKIIFNQIGKDIIPTKESTYFQICKSDKFENVGEELASKFENGEITIQELKEATNNKKMTLK